MIMATGPIELLMTSDHADLARLLEEADAGDAIAREPYQAFRRGLLRHIAMEEKILLPFARRKREGKPLAIAVSLRADHGQIAKLLVPTPTRAVCEQLRALLATHNALEEGPQGLYAICDALAADEAEGILARLRAYPAVPVASHYDGPSHSLHRRVPSE